MRGLLAAAVVVAISPAYAEPAKHAKPAPREWKAKRVVPARPLPPPAITLAVFDATADVRQARLLHNQGISAYQAGRYDSAVRKFAAAMSSNPTPELIFHAAQAYRLKGDRAKAIELYEQYLDVAPRGPAANACRGELEKLRDVP
jgi:tetratricopeptide (TPR) repeat protein